MCRIYSWTEAILLNKFMANDLIFSSFHVFQFNASLLLSAASGQNEIKQRNDTIESRKKRSSPLSETRSNFLKTSIHNIIIEWMKERKKKYKNSNSNYWISHSFVGSMRAYGFPFIVSVHNLIFLVFFSSSFKLKWPFMKINTLNVSNWLDCRTNERTNEGTDGGMIWARKKKQFKNDHTVKYSNNFIRKNSELDHRLRRTKK